MVNYTGGSRGNGCAGGSRRHEARRWKANSRERTRMHCLNAALDNLQLLMPVDPCLYQSGSMHQKLSKIETLRMAINYISALQRSLSLNEALDLMTFWRLLTRGLSQQTAQLVAASLRLCTPSTSGQQCRLSVLPVLSLSRSLCRILPTGGKLGCLGGDRVYSLLILHIRNGFLQRHNHTT